MPDTLPNFFRPYSLPVNSLLKYAIQALFGASKYEKFSKEYDKRRRADMGYADLKRVVKDTLKSESEEEKIYQEITKKGFMGERYLALHSDKTSQTQFWREFEMFDNSGIINSPNFKIGNAEFDLPKLLAADINDNSHQVILYTGFLGEEDYILKRFIVIHFMETMRVILKAQKSMTFRNILVFPEIQDLCKPLFGNELTEIDFLMPALMKEWMFRGRHWNTDIWADTKPKAMEQSVHKNFDPIYVTSATQDVLSDMTKHTHHQGSDLITIFGNPHYKATKGFIDLKKAKIPQWKDNVTRTYTYGYRTFAVKRTTDREQLITNDDFTPFYSVGYVPINLYNLKVAFGKARTESEKKLVEQTIRKIIHDREERSRAEGRGIEKEEGKQKILTELQRRLEEQGAEAVKENFPDWALDWADEYNVEKRTIERWTEMWRKTKLKAALEKTELATTL